METTTDQATTWDAVADSWEAHQGFVEAAKEPVTSALLAALELHDGASVLEVGAGPGTFARRLADAVGPSGRVVATDVSPRMAAAAARATDDLAQVEAGVADVDDLAAQRGRHDAAVGRMSLMFSADPGHALAELASSLCAGGRLAVAVWGPPPANPWVVTVGMSAAAAGVPVVPPFGPGGPFSLADPERLAALLTAAGLVDVRVEEVALRFPYPDAEAHVASSSTLAPNLAEAFAGLDPAVRAEVVDRVAAADEPHRDGGVLAVPGLALVASGRRP